MVRNSDPSSNVTTQAGTANSNYRHGKHCEPQLCGCGNEKDYRAERCGICARCSKPKNGESIRDESKMRRAIEDSDSFLKASKVAEVSRQTITRLDTSHFRPCRDRPFTHEELFTKGTAKRNASVKKALRSLIPYICKLCGLPPEWNGQELVLEMDHIDGDPTNNLFGNLRFLCPNCHTQTPTCKGRNSRGVRKVRR